MHYELIKCYIGEKPQNKINTLKQMIDFQLFAFLFYKKNILFTTIYHQKNFRNLSCSSKEKPKYTAIV